jgi:glutamate N-acetyltransferase/amino-acid N-acetyltransferase
MQKSCSAAFLENGGIISPSGYAAFASRAGLKSEGDDILLVVSHTPATCAAVFTRNRIKAAPVMTCASHAASPLVRAIIANSGNANCCTGETGLRNARRTCEVVASVLDCKPEQILVCSTGIIGHALPMHLVEPAVHSLATRYGAESTEGSAGNESAARAFMTTDTRPKFCAAQAHIGGKLVSVGGQAKGSGMIAPDMAALHATMLCFLTTDAAIEKTLLQRCLEHVIARSLNSVTIDGDTSTNDSTLLLANGAGDAVITEDNYQEFCDLLLTVCQYLAREIARDGEGATHLIAVQVVGARSEADAKKVAMTVANSPLVKTAIFGGDPNWGRVAAAAGRAGVDFDASKLCIDLGEVRVFTNGEPAQFAAADAEAALSMHEVPIVVALGEGQAGWTVWTCDYSYDYIRINAEYHT